MAEFLDETAHFCLIFAPLADDFVSVSSTQAFVERLFALCARKRNRAFGSLER